ncbi:MAG TPA: hypothetical protein VKV05_11460 [Terriglobales bacterium]|nr:hypothetical protein [Terriglobales bacterium]
MTRPATLSPMVSGRLLRSAFKLLPVDQALPKSGLVQASTTRSRPWGWLTCIFVLQLSFFSFLSLHRFIDGDEGFYLLASRLVLLHKRPYLDFFYTQAPLLPYVYGLGMKLAGVTWVSGRLLAALFTAVLGTMLCQHVHLQTGNWRAGLLVVVLFATTTLIFAWFPVVKAFSLAGVFLFAAYVVVSSCQNRPLPWPAALAGLLFGLSVDTRSYLLLLTPLFLYHIYRNYEAKARKTSLLWFVVGLLVANLPAFYFFLLSPRVFLFNNLGFHAIRSGNGLVALWGQKLVTIVVALLGSKEGNGIQATLLLVISLAFVSSLHDRSYPPRFAFQLAVAIAFISLLPTPVLIQYFCLCIPFLLVSTVCVANELLLELRARRTKWLAIIGFTLIAGLYFAASIPDFQKYFVTGGFVPDPADWSLQRVGEISRAIDQTTSPGEPVASFWPGDVFQTHAISFPGFENDFGLPISEALTSEQRTRFHLLSPGEIQSDFAAHQPRVVVLRQEVFSPPDKPHIANIFRGFLAAQGYRVVRSIGGVSIYVYGPK